MVHRCPPERYVADAAVAGRRLDGADGEAEAAGTDILDQDVLGALGVYPALVDWHDRKAVVLLPDGRIVDVDVAPRYVEAVRVKRPQVPDAV